MTDETRHAAPPKGKHLPARRRHGDPVSMGEVSGADAQVILARLEERFESFHDSIAKDFLRLEATVGSIPDTFKTAIKEIGIEHREAMTQMDQKIRRVEEQQTQFLQSQFRFIDELKDAQFKRLDELKDAQFRRIEELKEAQLQKLADQKKDIEDKYGPVKQDWYAWKIIILGAWGITIPLFVGIFLWTLNRIDRLPVLIAPTPTPVTTTAGASK
jgi:hypothetical protein